MAHQQGPQSRSPEGINGTPARAVTVFGRQGSPTITLALPFSHIEVKADDAAPWLAELAVLTARLARAFEHADVPEATARELAAVAIAADALAARAPGG